MSEFSALQWKWKLHSPWNRHITSVHEEKKHFNVIFGVTVKLGNKICITLNHLRYTRYFVQDSEIGLHKRIKLWFKLKHYISLWKKKVFQRKTWLQWQICSEQNLNPETKSICDLWRKTALSWRNLPHKLIRFWIDQFMKKKSNFSVIFAMTDLPTFLEKYVIRDTEKKHIASTISTVFLLHDWQLFDIMVEFLPSFVLPIL